MDPKEIQSSEKLRGGYYTPADLAAFLVRWVELINPKKVLEPSCGDGAFFDAIGGLGPEASVVGFELDKNEAAKSRRRIAGLGLQDTAVHALDFLGWAIESMESGAAKFDAVVGNPPFIRYQYLPGHFQKKAETIFKKLDCGFTKHTNAWVPFVLASFELLRPGGRLAMVVPAEIIHVMHARSLRSYLGENSRRLVVVDPDEIWFDGTLQGAVLLLVEKKTQKLGRTEGLGMFPVRGRGFLDLHPEDVFNAPRAINGKTIEAKWTRALLPVSTSELLDELSEKKLARPFQDVAEVDVGIITGANRFFLVGDDVVKRFRLQKWAHPMFGRSEHCPSVIYDEDQHKTNALKGKPTNFIWFQDSGVEKTVKGKEYIKIGEDEKLHTRYKCRTRKPWYAVPSVYATDVGMLKRCHNAPRLILNKLKAFTTDTAYRVRAKEGAAEQLVYGFINGLTALSAELEGRHYGGGVLELVPSEIEKLLLPPTATIKPDVKALDAAIRSMPMDSVLAVQTGRVLGGLGLSEAQRDELLSGWSRLRDRRHRVLAETA